MRTPESTVSRCPTTSGLPMLPIAAARRQAHSDRLVVTLKIDFRMEAAPWPTNSARSLSRRNHSGPRLRGLEPLKPT